MARLTGRLRRGMSLPGRLLPLGAVLGPALLAIPRAGRVQGAADDVVAHAREVLHPTSTDQDHRVLLQVVPDAGNVGGDLDLAGQPHARDLSQRGVGLLRSGGVDAHADAAPLGRALQRRGLRLLRSRLAAIPNKLLYGRQRFLLRVSESQAATAGWATSGDYTARHHTRMRGADRKFYPVPTLANQAAVWPAPRRSGATLPTRLKATYTETGQLRVELVEADHLRCPR